MTRTALLALVLPLSLTLAVPALVAQDGAAASQENRPDAPAPAAAERDDTAAVPVEKKAKPRPRLEIVEPIHDLGKLQKGERAEIVFVLSNRGDATLRIRSAQPSCGCTVTAFDEQVAAGGTGEVRALLDTSTLEGAISKSVTVVTNDPDSPRVVLTIRAEVLSYVRVSPSYARLLQVRSLAPATVAVHLWSEDGGALELGAIDPGADWITATARRAGPAELRPGGPAEQWRLEISSSPEAPLGPITHVVVVSTDHPKQPRVEVPLSGFVRPLLSTVPAAADFGALGPRAKDPRQFVLTLFNFGDAPIEVRSAATDLGFVSVTVEPDEPGRRYRLRLALAEDAPKGKFEGLLRVETSSAEQPMVEVPVHGRIR